ncbi:Rapid alkalinization factor [Platanthera zijinensis]|uniref:Rapid alkalinization factor n=1 Tax=Platanthera zijinensis TaxID=2320716 RepID=A0AAP0FYK7_9ASPA
MKKEISQQGSRIDKYFKNSEISSLDFISRVRLLLLEYWIGLLEKQECLPRSTSRVPVYLSRIIRLLPGNFKSASQDSNSLLENYILCTPVMPFYSRSLKYIFVFKFKFLIFAPELYTTIFSVCQGTIGECIACDDEFDLAPESAHTILDTSGYISYEALKRGCVTYSRRSASYYNCRHGGEAYLYSRRVLKTHAADSSVGLRTKNVLDKNMAREKL